MSTLDAHEDPCHAGGELVPAGGARLRQLDDQANAEPRVVTTGRKTTQSPDGVERILNIDEETGEPVHLYASGGHGIKAGRNLVPDGEASPGIAQIDALAFTVIPPNDAGPTWVIAEMRQFLEVEAIEQRGGCFGFTFSMRFGEGAGLCAWGGKSQRDRVYFSIQGKGCGTVKDWPALAAWMRAHRAAFKRVDVAYDDLAGEIVNIDWAVAQFKGDGFKAGGRKPSHQLFGDWLSGTAASKGRTLGIGSRESGKYCRIYEKGKLLGDPESRWTRVEVEWRGQDRVIPYDVLTRPGQYLAGAYPCLRSLSIEQSRIKTIAKGGTIAYERAVATGRLHTGKLVNLMLHVLGGDYAAVVDKLKRAGTPARIGYRARSTRTARRTRCH